MDETILFPSPNWFQVSGLVVTSDDWVIYGGPSRSLCVLEPHPRDYEAIVQKGYQTHVVSRAHPEKIVSVDVTPEWPARKAILTGSADGLVKQWNFVYDENTLKIKSSYSHEVHSKGKEMNVGVGYSTDSIAITVGEYGSLVKWDFTANIVNTNNNILKNFKPTSMSCSRHMPLHVAVGTKQGLVFLLDLNGPAKIVYKIRALDEEISQLSWCPQYEVIVKKKLKDTSSSLSARLEKIRNEPAENNDSGIVASNTETPEKTQVADNSADESEVIEEDMFDVYKDPADDEFGHKKYQPEDIFVEIPKTEEKEDFLAECLKLKSDILKRKNEPEPSIEALVNAIDNTHIEADTDCKVNTEQTSTEVPECDTDRKVNTDKTSTEVPNASASLDSASSVHIHRHLLVSIGKQGGVRVWSKTGKQVAQFSVNSGVHGGHKKQFQPKLFGWMTVLWYKPNVLLISDGKSQLLECDPLSVDCKNKLECRVVHSLHKRGLFCIASGAPRVTDGSDNKEYSVWTAGQDRNVIKYCMKERIAIATYGTLGGFVYSIAPCPYDANKVAVGVGDGAVRVVSLASPSAPTRVASHWQNVQGKVLAVAWHPQRDNCLAFSTAEARVGLIDTGGKVERPARVLNSSLSGAVYGLCWGDGNILYACGGGDLHAYNTAKAQDPGTQIPVAHEGKQWKLCEVKWTESVMLVGSEDGAVAALNNMPPYDVKAVCYPFTKMIYTIIQHPLQMSGSAQESSRRDVIAVSSAEKQNLIALINIAQTDGEVKLNMWKTLVGHKAVVLQLAWSPHTEGTLISTSQDMTVRVWDIESGSCTHILGRSVTTLSCAFLPGGRGGGAALSAGGDCCLNVWRLQQHTADRFIEPKVVPKTQKSKKKAKVTTEIAVPAQEYLDSEDQPAITPVDVKTSASKKFLLPLISNQVISKSLHACRKMFKKIKQAKENQNKDSQENGKVENAEVENGEDGSGDAAEEIDTDYLKIFGSINEVNEILDKELERLEMTDQLESYAILCVFRGQMDAMYRWAAQRDFLCPFLLSLAPSVSAKYWKDVMAMYLAQVDRLTAKGEHLRLTEPRHYGGVTWRAAALRLALLDARAAVKLLTEKNLYKDAYVLCRVRYMDSIAEDVLKEWARYCNVSSNLNTAAVCHLVLGQFSEATSALSKSNDEEYLLLAEEIAKFAGQHTYAEHIAEKRKHIQNTKQTIDEDLEALPTRMELLMKNGQGRGESQNKEGQEESNCKEDVKVATASDGATVGRT